ncbi:MAG: LLM class flavin-dependent oxidoreductase [Ilumatobacteraceae bacterium]|nr:LLM class flavin-dependent oxidoreductase [Ilumatobacteraceae bacterium]
MSLGRAVPLSVLDLSILREGATSADALAQTTALAQCAQESDYHRFWVAEHHNMPSVACTTPPVLIAHLAGATERIIIGSGGVMLPNHAPLVVAEQFAMLEALHPGRIDVGIGRAPGTDQHTAGALRRSEGALGAEDFPQDLFELMDLLGDRRFDTKIGDRFKATPAATSFPRIFLLGSSGYSAHLAARLGLPFGFAHHFDMGGTFEAAEIYRSRFEPSHILREPYMIVTANVLAADSDEEAHWHSKSARLTGYLRRTGRFLALPSAQDAANHPDIDQAERMPSSRIVGEASKVAEQLHQLVARIGANEAMVTAVAYDTDARVRSLQLLNKHW